RRAQLCCLLRHALLFFFVLFFFSSRRRHTRLQGDWSSDVCSSDLLLWFAGGSESLFAKYREIHIRFEQGFAAPVKGDSVFMNGRSEERRVGKECRSRWSPDD